MVQTRWGYIRSVGALTAVSLLFGLNLAQAGLQLSDNYQVSKGEMAAIQLTIYAPIAWLSALEQYDAPMLAFYDKTDFKIIANIYGVREGVEEARKIIEVYVNLLEVDFIPYLKRVQGIDLKPEDLRITYRNRNEEGIKELLIWDGGKYKFPVSK
jgi:hypothetical protein